MKKKQTPQSLVYGALNKIYYTSRDIAKEWGSKSIPLNTFKELIDKSKLDIDGELDEFKTSYNNMLDILYDTCFNSCKKLETKNVNVKFIKSCIEHIKENMGL